VGSPAYLYVRVKNRGTNVGGSGPVTVNAFHCLPGMGLLWPTGWTPTVTPSINVPNVAPGPAGAIVVGPFDWTPTVVGHECVLVTVECANDRALTQDLLASDVVSHSDLVPFDNNIAQRNLVPTEAKGSSVRGFNVGNPFAEPHTVHLYFEDDLPKGWRWRANDSNIEKIELGPYEQRWIEIAIDQADGEEVTTFEQTHKLTITGTIEDRVIGGMTFYIAPPSTFLPSPHDTGSGRDVASRDDPQCLNLPWNDLIVEGELNLHLRLKSKP
jgi:hypothetical protein